MLPTKKAKEKIVSDDEVDVVPPVTMTTNKLKDTMKDIQYFSQSKSMTKMTEELMSRKKVIKFTEKLSHVLNNVSELKMDDLTTIFLFVLQSCSDYFGNSMPDDEKLQLCTQLLKPFMKNDEVLTGQVIRMVESRIKKSTFYRRNKKWLIKTLTAVFLASVKTH